jgi:hypothetical protein
VLVPYGQPVQFIAVLFGVRHVGFQESYESLVVCGLQQVDHFVDDDVFQAFWWFFGYGFRRLK